MCFLGLCWKSKEDQDGVRGKLKAIPSAPPIGMQVSSAQPIEEKMAQMYKSQPEDESTNNTTRL